MSSADRGSLKVNQGDANILMLQKRNAVIHCMSSQAASGNVFANIFGSPSNLIHKAANLDATQTFDSSKDGIAIKDVVYSIDGDVTIERYTSDANRANVLLLTQGQGHLQFPAEIPLQSGNLLVHFGSTEGTVTLGVSKGDAFVDPNTQRLEARDRGPF